MGQNVLDYELFEGDVLIYKGPLTTYTKHNIVPGRKYDFSVLANNSCGDGKMSDTLYYDTNMVSNLL